MSKQNKKTAGYGDTMVKTKVSPQRRETIRQVSKDLALVGKNAPAYIQEIDTCKQPHVVIMCESDTLVEEVVTRMSQHKDKHEVFFILVRDIKTNSIATWNVARKSSEEAKLTKKNNKNYKISEILINK